MSRPDRQEPPHRLPAKWVFMALILAGCAGTGKSTEAPADVDAPDPVMVPAPAVVATETPQALYDACGARVEDPQVAGECKVDADCAPTGCGGEVCAAAAEKANVVTTCEDKLCFKILDVCGCHEGSCTWTLKAEVPVSQVPVNPLPSSLPLTNPPPVKDGKGAKAPAAPPPAP